MGVLLTLTGLWVAGFSPLEWWASWRAEHKAAQAVATAAPYNRPSTISLVAAPPAPKGNDTSVSKVPLSLILVSTQPAPTLSESIALIGVDASSPQTYAGGAVLANGARIADIQREFVVLQKGGRSARLYVESTSKTAAQTVAQSAAVRKLIEVGGPQSSAPPLVPIREVVTDYIRPAPVYENGSLSGYQVYAGSHAGVFSQWGLQPGDIVKALNHVPLTDSTSATQMFQQLAEGVAFAASVERKGQTVQLSLDGTLIAEAERSTALSKSSGPLPGP